MVNERMRKSVWINVCESSADAYGALLMQELQQMCPGMRIMGMGGRAMRRQGLETVYRAEDLSLVGLTEVVTALPRIAGYLREIKRLLRRERPSVLVLMDAPDFNFRLAREACRLGIPVIYYIAPQVWAWRRSRIKFLREFVHRVACIFPFEQDFFLSRGIVARYVGHPLLDLIHLPELNLIAPQENRIALLPGSRKKEIASLLPVFTDVAYKLSLKHPDLSIGIVQAPGVDRDFIKSHTRDLSCLEFISPENRHTYLKSCSMALAVSGTITLECAILDVPAIVAYKVSWPSYMAGRMLIDVPYISMPNLILDRGVFPEFIQSRANSKELLQAAGSWLDHPRRLADVRHELAQVKDLLGKKTATRNTAEMIMQAMYAG